MKKIIINLKVMKQKTMFVRSNEKKTIILKL